MKSVNYYTEARIHKQLHNKVAVYDCHNSWPHLRLNPIKLLIPKSLASREAAIALIQSLIFARAFKRNTKLINNMGKKVSWLLLLLLLIHWFLLTNFTFFVNEHLSICIDVDLITVMKLLLFLFGMCALFFLNFCLRADFVHISQITIEKTVY